MAELSYLDDKATTLTDVVTQLEQINELVGVIAIQQLRIYDLLLLLNLGAVGSASATEEKIFEAVAVHESGGTLGPEPAYSVEDDEPGA